MLDDVGRKSLCRWASWCALVFAVGYPLGGAVALNGNITLVQAVSQLGESGATDAFSLSAAWWSLVFGNGLFIVSNTALGLCIASLVYLFGTQDWRLLVIGMIVILWVPVALFVDSSLAASTWINGLQTGDGLDPEQFAHVYTVIQEREYNMLRWPARGFYLFIGLAMFLLSRTSNALKWSRGLSAASMFFAIALWLEVVTFLMTMAHGSSPLQLPAYLLNFLLAAPLWGFMMFRTLRQSSIETV